MDVTLEPWAGNFVVPSELVPWQMSIPRWRRPADVSVVLVTRFWAGATPPPDGWESRRELMRRYCLPSVVGQTVPPDAWLVLVNAADRHEVAGVDWPVRTRFVPMPPSGEHGSAITSGIRRGLVDFYLKRRVVVARCDGDDALAEDFVEGLLKYVSAARLGEDPTLVTYTTGLQYDVTNGETRLDVRSEGHFHAVVQRSAETLVGPYGDAHSEVWKTGTLPVVPVTTRFPMWCEVVHDHNAVNRMRPGPRLDPGWRDRFHLREE